MEEPEMYDDDMEYDDSYLFSSGDSSSEKLKKKKNSRVVRSHFPETWLFQLEPVDEKGKAVVSLKVIIIIQVAITPLLITVMFVTQGARHPHFVDGRGYLHEQEHWNWTCQPIKHCGQEGQYYNLLCKTLQIVVFVLVFEQTREELYRISLLTCAFPIL